MRSARKYTQVGIGLIFFCTLLFFVYHQTRGLLAGASVSVQSPQNGALFHEPTLTLSGTAKKVSFISVNGRQIFTDEDGKFEELLLLAPGYTIITVSAEDTFKRKVQKQIEVVYQPTRASSSPSSRVLASTTAESMP